MASATGYLWGLSVCLPGTLIEHGERGFANFVDDAERRGWAKVRQRSEACPRTESEATSGIARSADCESPAP